MAMDPQEYVALLPNGQERHVGMFRSSALRKCEQLIRDNPEFDQVALGISKGNGLHGFCESSEWRRVAIIYREDVLGDELDEGDDE
jgi:hypothetical protein